MEHKKIWGMGGILLLLITALCLSNLDFMVSLLGGALKILTPFLYGMVIAYLLSPICSKIEGLLLKLSKKRAEKLCKHMSILFTIMIALFSVGLIIYLVVPQIVTGLGSLFGDIPELIEMVETKLTALVGEYPDVAAQIHQTAEKLAGELGEINIGQILETVGNSASGTVGTVYDVVIGIIFSIYLLGGRKKLKIQGKRILGAMFPPEWNERIQEELVYANKAFSGFLTGKFLDSMLLGVIAYFMFTLLGFDSSLFFAVVIGVTNMIPFFGPFIGMIPCALLCYMNQGAVHMLCCILLIFVLQQFDGNFLGPKILGGKTGLSSMWVFFAITFFGSIFGVAGMIFGVPLFAVIYDVIKKLVVLREKE